MTLLLDTHTFLWFCQDDPLLSARSAVYSQSFTRREGEARQPSAITPADVRRGD